MSLSEKILILLLAAGALFFCGFDYGKSSERKAAQVRKLAATEQAIDKAADVAKQDAKVATSQEQTRERIRTVYRTITREVEKNVAENPAYLRCGLDADGLCWWNAANQGDPLGSACQRDAGLSGLASGGGRQPGVTVPQPQGSGAVVPGVPGVEPGQSGDHQEP